MKLFRILSTISLFFFHSRMCVFISSFFFPLPSRYARPVAPVCTLKEVTIIGASLEESVKVRCEVDADPSEVDFFWEFNNSGENFEVTGQARFDGNNGTMSELVYTPQSERDYGALTCRGRNAIGKQETPCIYQVIPAGDTFIASYKKRKMELFVEFFIESLHLFFFFGIEIWKLSPASFLFLERNIFYVSEIFKYYVFSCCIACVT